MGSSTDPLEFFEQVKARSLHKLGLLERYLQPLTFKLGSTTGANRSSRHIWVVDGFAGAGAYRPDDTGRIQDGSPLITAKWARAVDLKRGYDLVRCINVERDPTCLESLRRELAPWQDLVSILDGEFADHLPAILDEVAADPALFFLDPFGVRGVEMDLVRQIAAREGKTELLLHFSDRTFLRMAGHLDDNKGRLPVGHKQAETKLAGLDALVGSKRWRLLLAPGADAQSGIEAVAELYLEQLRHNGWPFAHQIRIRDAWADRPAYRLVFATRSPHGVALMSDLVCRYERGIEGAASAGQMTLWHHDEVRREEALLKGAIYEEGLSAGSISRVDLELRLAPRNFGRFVASDYAKRIRELVAEGLIDRANAKGIADHERLEFVVPAQVSLFGGPELPTA